MSHKTVGRKSAAPSACYLLAPKITEEVAEACLRGFEDVKHGRTVPVDSALAEGRRRIAEYRTKTKFNRSDNQEP